MGEAASFCDCGFDPHRPDGPALFEKEPGGSF